MSTTQYVPLLAVRRNVVLRRGDDDPPIEWVFGSADTPTILNGSQFVLTYWPHGQEAVTVSSAAPGSRLTVDTQSRVVRWAYAVSDTAALPTGRGTYELRRIFGGKQRTWVRGAFIVLSEDPDA